MTLQHKGRALMLLSNAYTHDGRVRQEVRSLVGAGYRVTVLCWDRGGDQPRDEVLDGARIFRFTSDRAMRLHGFDLFRLRPLQRRLVKEALELNDLTPFDLVHAHDLDTLRAGIVLKHRLDVPLVYDAHEVFGYMLAKDLPAPVARRFLRLERRMAPQVDHLMTVSAPVADHLRPLLAPDTPITLVMNAKEVPDGPPVASGTDTFTLVYIGTMNPTRFVLETAEAVAATEGVRLVLAGGGKPEYAARVQRVADSATNIEWLGRIPSDDVVPRTVAADCVVCLFDPKDPLTRIGMPNKVFEAMAAGRPVLTSKGTYLGHFVEEHDMGMAVQPTAAGIRTALEALRDDPERVRAMGEAARRTGQEGHDWPTQAERLVAVYRSLVEHPLRGG